MQFAVQAFHHVSHIFFYLFGRNDGINLRGFDVAVSQHLRNAFDGNTVGERNERSETMSSLMECERTCHSDTFFNHFHRVENCPLSRCVKHKSRFSALVFFDDFQGLRKQSQTVRRSGFLPFPLHPKGFVCIGVNVFLSELDDVDKRYSGITRKNKHISHRVLAFQLESQITDLFQFVSRDTSGKGFRTFTLVTYPSDQLHLVCSTSFHELCH